MKRKVICAFTFIMLMLMAYIPASASGITVKLDKIVNEFTLPVDFDEPGPMSINNSTVVPLRKLCERSGFLVSWNGENQTADITLNANENSTMPIERYAYSILSKADIRGLDLKPNTIEATIKLNENFIYVRYNYSDSNGDTISFGEKLETSIPVTLTDEQAVVIPIRSLMETFGLWIEWNENVITISIPPYVIPLNNMELVTYEQFINEVNPVVEESLWFGDDTLATEAASIVVETNTEVINNNPDGIPAGAIYVGNFKITHYCSCEICCGSFGNSTAWAGAVIPGTTIAVDPSVIPKLSNVYIEGYGIRRAEDCGSAIKGNKIDVAVANHQTAMDMGVCYKDVWILP